MHYLTAAVTTLLTLSACATQGVTDARETIAFVSPNVIYYSQEQRERAISEVEQNLCPMHIEFGKDYQVMRDQVRAMKK